MLHEPVLLQLHALGLGGFAQALATQVDDDSLAFHTRLALLLEAEVLRREELRIAQRLKAARLPEIALLADVDLRSARGLSKAQWARLTTLNWLHRHQHLLLIGPTGIGKSFLACALARAAAQHGQSVRYLRLPRLADELVKLRAEQRLSNWLKNMSRVALLILDDFGLVPLANEHQPLLLELIEDRRERGSAIVTSQLPLHLWHAQFADPTLADAILDRLVHRGETVELKGESMRKLRSLRERSDQEKRPTG
jgi:DNA replication protein DnaC